MGKSRQGGRKLRVSVSLQSGLDYCVSFWPSCLKKVWWNYEVVENGSKGGELLTEHFLHEEPISK